MFADRYFAPRYFAARYFGEGGGAPPVGAGGYFGRRYFGARYFAPRYFSIRAEAPTPPTPTPGPSGGAGRGLRGGRRRWFDYPNIIDDPNLFRPEPIKEPEKQPEPIARQPYVDGDEVEPPAGPSSLADVGTQTIERLPAEPKAKPDKKVDAIAGLLATVDDLNARLAKLEKVSAEAAEEDDDEQEEMRVLRMLGFL